MHHAFDEPIKIGFAKQKKKRKAKGGIESVNNKTIETSGERIF